MVVGPTIVPVPLIGLDRPCSTLFPVVCLRNGAARNRGDIKGTAGGRAYHCVCAADHTGQALFHTLYGRALKHISLRNTLRWVI
ncbi:hypothetical protein MKW98_003631 [Papaver atlanticum]|uniref:Uncharacterized protein n=1 Tax=Papaver atlanticum TaxID=357466 RepID=A0AAD4SH98_9MAGN|nr:hypothetical protein MKW98_003631 [Papaver atlanticum]